jgi:hypothetical protein
MFGNPEEQLGEILVIHFFLRSLECFDLALNGAKSLATEANSSVDSVDTLTFPFWNVHRKCHLQSYVSTGVDAFSS